jgi:hypothetical protein
VETPKVMPSGENPPDSASLENAEGISGPAGREGASC